MELIKREAAKAKIAEIILGASDFANDMRQTCYDAIDAAPAIDAVPVVRCGECRYHSFDEAYGNHWCNLTLSCRKVAETDFCSQGARMDGEEAPHEH